MNFLYKGFQNLSSDRHTYRQTDMTKIIYDATSQVVNKENRNELITCIQSPKESKHKILPNEALAA